MLGMIYDNQGHVANCNPYLHFAAYAHAERGGYMSLSLAELSWTAPLRRKSDAPAPPPLHGSDWDPALFHNRPFQLFVYDTMIINGKEPREMTVQMAMGYKLKAQSGDWLLYTRY
jgi:hypothetical protein